MRAHFRWYGICVGQLTMVSAALLPEYERPLASAVSAAREYTRQSPAQMLPPFNYYLGNYHQAGSVSDGGYLYPHPTGYQNIQTIPILPNPYYTAQHAPYYQATSGQYFYPPPYFPMYYGVPTDGSAQYMRLPNGAYILYPNMNHREGSFQPSQGPWGNSHDWNTRNQGPPRNRQLRSRVMNQAHPISSHRGPYDGNYQQEPLQHSQKYGILKMNNQGFSRYKSFSKKNSKQKNVEPLNIDIEVLKSINPIIGSEEYKSKNQLLPTSDDQTIRGMKKEVQIETANNLQVQKSEGTQKESDDYDHNTESTKSETLSDGKEVETLTDGKEVKLEDHEQSQKELSTREVLLSLIKRHTGNYLLPFQVSELEYKVFKDNGIESWDDWKSLINIFVDSFPGSEGKRLACSMIAGFDQYKLRQRVSNLPGKINLTQMEGSKILQLNADWPVFYKNFLERMTARNQYPILFGDDLEYILKVISSDEFQLRYTSFAVMSQANISRYKKFFSESQLQHYLKAGLIVPIIQQIDNIFELSAGTSPWARLKYEDIENKVQDFYQILRGRLVKTPVSYLTENKSWLLTPESDFLLRDVRVRDRFLKRLKGLVVQAQMIQLSYVDWEKDVITKDHELNKEEWEHQTIDGAEALASALVALPMKDFAYVKFCMLKATEGQSPRGLLQWPPVSSIPDDIKLHVEQIKQVYKFLGVKVLGLD